MFQVYFDFSGYSDMAIGLGRIFGFHFLENFNYPFVATSISDFWRRWHISMGAWFRDYVYIPLGGNRVSPLRHIGNIFVVWFLTGLWHGAQWNYVFWGLYFALLLIIEKTLLIKWVRNKSIIFRRIYPLFFVTVSFAIFNADGMSGSLENLKGMFGLLEAPFTSMETMYYLKSYGLTLIIAGVCSTPVIQQMIDKLSKSEKGRPVFALCGTTSMYSFVATNYRLLD